ncbi:heavy metal-associated isoprenylated plant protein 20-like [Rutidosis leptorrhynchoides]|uniref:heavy metal-associated isoprenylated plant protein 20-like n=1 Tax=Rutidosis leptorrhynchoides TaxID=125765 RepID=UPI003A99A9D3
MGYLDHISDLFSVSSPKKHKRKTMQIVEIKVKMDCDGCVRKVKSAASSSKGVKSVEVDQSKSRVTVKGYVDPKKVLKKIQETGKKAEMWPYVPYNLVHYPYAPQAYDKKAPKGYVKNVPQAYETSNNPNEEYTTLFSDENPNACSIM